MLAEPAVRTLRLQAKLFRGLADPSRLSIPETLREGPLHVGATVARTKLSQPDVSNHLRCMSECGLVRAEQRGRFVHYRLSDGRIAELLQLADELLIDVACGIGPCGNYGEPKEGRP